MKLGAVSCHCSRLHGCNSAVRLLTRSACPSFGRSLWRGPVCWPDTDEISQVPTQERRQVHMGSPTARGSSSASSEHLLRVSGPEFDRGVLDAVIVRQGRLPRRGGAGAGTSAGSAHPYPGCGRAIGNGWVHGLMFDGYRVQAHKAGSRVVLFGHYGTTSPTASLPWHSLKGLECACSQRTLGLSGAPKRW
jgi:hypothetical protein